MPRPAAAPSAASRARGCGSSPLAQGWCLMDANRPLEAARAFARAGESSSAKQRSDAAYGESLAYLRQGLTDRAAAAALKAPLSPDRQKELQAAILADRATSAFRQGRYSEALVALDQRAAIAGERVDLMVLRGYAYLKLRRKSEARRVFAAAASIGDAEARKGLRLVDEANFGR
jgi:Flp pilus assembly protein TadD